MYFREMFGEGFGTCLGGFLAAICIVFGMV